MKKLIFFMLVASLFFISCGTMQPATSPAVTDVSMLQGTWQLNYITGPRIAFDGLYPNKKPTLIVDVTQKRISGNSGCNSYSGALVAGNGTIDFTGPVAATKMMCSEGILGETTFFEMLKKVNKFSISSDTLNLLAGEIPMMRFTKK